jgi:hypothetical protein
MNRLELPQKTRQSMMFYPSLPDTARHEAHPALPGADTLFDAFRLT